MILVSVYQIIFEPARYSAGKNIQICSGMKNILKKVATIATLTKMLCQ